MHRYLLIIPLLLTGCALVGKNPSPPSKLEEAIYRVETNVVPFVVLQTNLVPVNVPSYVTNVVTVTKTNVIGVVETNTSQVVITNTQYATNVVSIPAFHTNYSYTTSTTTKSTTDLIGGLVNGIAPGSGSSVAAGLLALLAIWGHMRSSKSQDTSVALAQEVETVREFIKTLPQGAKYDVAITSFLQAHQVDEGVAKQVLQIVENSVDNPEAKNAVAEIKNTLNTLTQPT